MSATACRLCAASAELFSDRGDLVLHRCVQCGFITGVPARHEAPEERYDRYYSSEQPSSPDARYDEWLARAETFLGIGRLLEVGAGAGGLVRVAMRRGWKVDATEVSRTGLELLQKTGARVFAGDLMDARYPDESFDLVVSLEVLEHLPEPMSHLKEVSRILRARGMLLLTTPNFDGLSRRWLGSRWRVIGPEHLGYFTPATLARALRFAGFSGATVRTRSLDTAAWGFSSGNRETARFDPVAAAALRDNINASLPLRVAKETVNAILGFTGLGDTLLLWARK